MPKIQNLDDAAAVIIDAQQNKQRLELRGLGTKTALGNQPDYDDCLDVSAMQGIIDYQPEELVLTVRAGTALSVIEAELAKANQMLAFEPADLSGILASKSSGTIGGVLATNLSGPRRLTAGAARDFLLGFDAVSGRGERFKSGGRVMKNVTGYDLSKLICGSYGTLAVVDEVTIKTLPRPETSLSLLFGCDDMKSAVAQIAAIFASPHEPSAAAILPQSVAATAGLDMAAAMIVVIRLEGIALSVEDRAAHLREIGQPDRDSALLAHCRKRIAKHYGRESAMLICWHIPAAIYGNYPAHRHLHQPLWRQWNQSFKTTFYADWAGGLLWFAGPSGAEFGTALRAALMGNGGGHAQLLCDRAMSKTSVPVFQPLPPAQASLTKRVKAAFDPLGVLNFGRMHNGM